MSAWDFHDAEKAEMEGYRLSAAGNLLEALKSYRKALEIYERIGRAEKMANCHNKIGNILLDQEKFSDALSHLQEGLAIQERLGGDYEAGVAMINIADALEHLGRKVDALKYYRRAHSLTERMPETGGKLMLDAAIREAIKRIS